MENIKTIVSKNFRRLVEDSGMKQKDIIERLKVDKSTFQRWKSGETFPELGNIERLADIIMVNPMDFYRVESKPLPVKDALRLAMSVPGEAWELIDQLDGEGWKQAMGIMRGYINEKKEKEAIAKA